MRIRAVETRLLSYPQAPPFRAGTWTFGSVDFVVVQVHTDAGLTGLGWVFAFGLPAARVLRAMVDLLAEVVVDQDPLTRRALWQRMQDSSGFLGTAGVATSAAAGIDLALYDVAAKAAGWPVYQFLGGSGAPVLAYASGGSLGLDPGRLAEEACRAVQAGFRAVKVKIGSPRLEDDVARVRRVRESLGPAIKVIADANQRWTPKQALRACAALDEYDLFWLEEPVAAEDIAGHARVTAGTAIPIATGETLFTRAACSALVERGGVDVLMPNLQRVGGVDEWLHLAKQAHERGVGIASHVFMEPSVHLLGCVPNAVAFEYLDWWPRFVHGGPVLDNGCVRPSHQPGWGVELDDEALRVHEVAA